MGQQTHLPPKQRKWVVEADEAGELDQEEILQALVEAATIVHRVGGVVMVGSVRQELPPDSWGVGVEGVYGTTHLVLKWESYAPAQRLEQPAPVEEPEPVAAG